MELIKLNTLNEDETSTIEGLSDDDLNNQKCPKCNEAFDFKTEVSHSKDGAKSYQYRVFERHNHICKK